ncbi:hypothetical protein [Marimonas lutisalis]|uniref:hypothetical protein n=1 Tax=Marimonas lutisalis TaxID=2545756 RepID=UPI0010F8181F|nr:hypothetical protein [Marimonas lutisalis]
MNRRQFNLGLATLGAVPALPIPPVNAAAAPLSGTAAMHYPWAVRYAKVHGRCTPGALARAFRLSPAVAGELFVKMQADGVIAAPGLSGAAPALNPINWDLQLSSTGQRGAATSLRARLRRALDDTLDDAGEAGLDEPDEETVSGIDAPCEPGPEPGAEPGEDPSVTAARSAE